MDCSERERSPAPRPPKMVADGWYLKGYADGYDARPPVMLLGCLGELYRKGYSQGLAAAERDFSILLGAISN